MWVFKNTATLTTLIPLQTKLPPSEQQAASELLEEFLPIAMRFLGDPYDDTSSQVFHVFSDILSTVSLRDASTMPNPISDLLF